MVFRAVVVVATNATATAQQSYDSWDEILGEDRKEILQPPHGHREAAAGAP